MSKKEFDPMDGDRPPREEGWKEETEMICHRLQNRGDQRIGQYLLNVISNTDKYDRIVESKRDSKEYFSEKEVVERLLWNIEAPELADAMREFDEEIRDKNEENDD